MKEFQLTNNYNNHDKYDPGYMYTLELYIYIESLMSCHLLLNLLHSLANMILCKALPSIISFLPTNVINLVINDNEFEILFIT